VSVGVLKSGGRRCPVHHVGTKDTRVSSAVQETAHAVLEEFDIETDEEADGAAGEL
jgi:hypothetical protein